MWGLKFLTIREILFLTKLFRLQINVHLRSHSSFGEKSHTKKDLSKRFAGPFSSSENASR